MPARSTKKPPTLSAGDHLRANVLELYELTPAELVLLDQAAAIADVLARLNEQVADEALDDTGSTGQRVAAPLLSAQREHARTLAQLLGAIALPHAGEIEGMTMTSANARKAAAVRWARERGAG